MAAFLETSIVCPTLIGRTPQLEAIARLIAQAAGGYGQVALIAGEAGIGKSRLVTEARTHATQHGFTILHGRCFEPDRALPYAPLRDLLRAELAARPLEQIATALGPMAPQLASLLPELLPLLPELVPTPALGPEEERRRLAEAFARFLSQRAAIQPLLVVIEDLHWSDEASLEMLLTLSRRCAAWPTLLLLTYRGDEVLSALNQMLAALERERLSNELRLAPLSYAEVDTMLRAIFEQRRPIRSEFLTALYQLTEGNPFFIEEILTSLVASGEIFYAHGQWDRKPLSELNIPRTVQVAVRRRVELLSPEAQRLLTLATVAGRRFDFELLQRLTAHDEGALLALIKALIAAQLVVEESAETFAFRHALTREALYTDLLARERKALHGLVAEALETVAQQRGSAAGEVWAAELAYHCYAAGKWAPALAYAQQAAQQAQRLYAPRAAIEQLSRAIESAHQLGQMPAAALLRARGQMRETLGEFDLARDDYLAALERALAEGDRPEEWQALLDLGFLWAERDYATMGDYLQRALALARTLDDPITLGRSLNRVGNWHLVVEQPRAALRYHQEALALFQAAADQAGLAATYDLLGVTQMMGGDIPAGVEDYTRAVALFRTLNDPRGLSSSLAMVSMRGASYPWSATVWPPIDAAACLQDGEEALRLARQIDWRAGEAGALLFLAFGHGPRGEYGLALERAQAGLEIAREIEHGGWLVGTSMALGVIALDLLALDLARQHLELALALARELGSFFVRNVASCLATTCVAQRDLACAEEVLAAALPTDTPMQMQGQRSAWCARAELALAASDPALALQIVDGLIDSAMHVQRYGAGCIPRLWLLRGQALAALGRVADAESALIAADQGARRLALPPIRWRIQCDLGRLHQGQGRRKLAESAFASARTIVEELAASVPDNQLRAGFLRSTATLIPQPAAPTPRRAAKHIYDGLTEREREIAVLIAQGQSNREIAAALVLSERTVATHVSNVLAKLNVASRAQIAAWASDKGLTKPY
jgi:DNA-binding CsgD family transcriptional regulator